MLQGFPADFVAVVGESAVRLVIGAGVRLSVVFVMKVGTILFIRWAGVTELQAGVGSGQRLVKLLVHLCSHNITHSEISKTHSKHTTHTKKKKNKEEKRGDETENKQQQFKCTLNFHFTGAIFCKAIHETAWEQTAAL